MMKFSTISPAAACAQFALALLTTMLAQIAAATCPKPAFSASDQVRIQSESVMIVTHAANRYDARLASKHGVQKAIRYARSQRIPLIYLADNNAGSAENFYIDDCNPDYWVFSTDGEIAFDVPASHVYVVGGHLEVCLINTLTDVFSRWARQPLRDRSVTYFMDGIYSNGSEIKESDPFHRDYMHFMNVVGYGKSNRTPWQKLTLLETMGLITSEARQLQYAERVLPFFPKLLPADYKVEIKLNDGAVKVVQKGRGARPPVLRFNFMDSASTLTKKSAIPAQGA